MLHLENRVFPLLDVKESAGDMPTIAGKSENFIAAKLKAFKSDSLDATIMNRIAKGFSDEEIAALAKFFSGK